MADIPKQLNTESDAEYALFLEYLSPQNGMNPMRTIGNSTNIREIAQRNLWISRALDWDIAQIK